MQLFEKEIKKNQDIISALQLKKSGADSSIESKIKNLQDKIAKIQKKHCIKLSPWQRVQICRHQDRPHTVDYLDNIVEDFFEIHGDRQFRDDAAIIGGLGYIGGQKCVIIGQEKGKDTEERIYRNFGMPHPEGYRKAIRIMKLAEKFSIPVVTLIDTPGAYPGLAAEERGQGLAIAENLLKMASLTVPIICLVIGEGCSGGALGIGIGDVVAMLEHSYYSVISPEGCASILWKDAKKSEHASKVLKMHAEDLQEFGVIDKILKEPLGGAHFDQSAVYKSVEKFIVATIKTLQKRSPQELLEQRYQKFRKIGVFEEKIVATKSK